MRHFSNAFGVANSSTYIDNLSLSSSICWYITQITFSVTSTTCGNSSTSPIFKDISIVIANAFVVVGVGWRNELLDYLIQ